MFSKETEYALRGLVYIHRQNTMGMVPGIDEIAREIDAPRFFTAKILQRMVRQGFLRSKKGKGGGFYFDESMPDLPLKNIIMSTEGEKTLSGCAFGLDYCNPGNPCPLHQRYAPIREMMNRLMESETIQSLARQKTGYFNPVV